MRWLMLVLAGGMGGILLSQRQTGGDLREGLASLRKDTHELTRLQEENRRLKDAKISTDELEKLQADQTAVGELRREIEALKLRHAERVRREAEELKQRATHDEKAKMLPLNSGVVAKSENEFSPTEGMVLMSGLKNAGLSTPSATVETALWAAVGGDVEALANTLVIDPPIRTKIEALIAQLPDAERSKLDTAERFVAFMTATEVPLGQVRIIQSKQDVMTAPHLTLWAQIIDPEGKTRMVATAIRPEGNEWRLIVPASAVEKYAEKLNGSPAPEKK